MFAASIATSPALVVQLGTPPFTRCVVCCQAPAAVAGRDRLGRGVRAPDAADCEGGRPGCVRTSRWVGHGVSWASIAISYSLAAGDGLIHNGYGRAILQHAASGHRPAALQGQESVFHFMPGLRYFHAVAFAVFGGRREFLRLDGGVDAARRMVLAGEPRLWAPLASLVGDRGVRGSAAAALPGSIGCVYPDSGGSLLFIGGLAGVIRLWASAN